MASNPVSVHPIIKKTPGDRGVFEIWRFSTFRDCRLIWRSQPWNNCPPLVFSQIIGAGQVLTVDEEARVTLSDYQRKKLIQSRSFEGSPPTGAVYTEDGQRLFLITRQSGNVDFELIGVDIKDLSVTHRHVLPVPVLPNRVSKPRENYLYIYFSVGSATISDNDGYVKINVETGATDVIFFERSPTGLFEAPPVLFSPDRMLGFRPHYDRVEILQKGCEKRYSLDLDIFDLKDAQTIKTFSARLFRPSHVFEDKDPRLALSFLELPGAPDEFLEARDEFLERVIALVPGFKGDSFWVVFHHGLIRQFDFDGRPLTPLITHPSNRQAYLDSSVDDSCFDTAIYVSEDNDTVWFGDPPTFFDTEKISKSELEDELIMVPESSTLVNSKTPHPDEISWNVIQVENTDSRDHLRLAIMTCLEIAGNIENTRDGHLFRFLFKSGNDYLSEKAVFDKTVTFPDLRNDLVNYVEALISYQLPLMETGDIPAGTAAVRALVLSDPRYIDLLIDFLSSGFVDSRNNSKALQQLVNNVITKYGWNDKTADLALTRAVFQTESGLDQLIGYMGTDAFQSYLETANASSRFFHHNLFGTLIEEYFELLLPVENELFEAVESEDIDRVRRLLLPKTRLDITHPEIGLTLFELAAEIKNEDVIQLLRMKGVKSQLKQQEPAGEGSIENNQTPGGTADLKRDLSLLKKRKIYMENRIAALEFEEMINRSNDPILKERLSTLNRHLDEVNQKIDQERIRLRQASPDIVVSVAESLTAKGNIHFDADLAELTIFVSNLSRRIGRLKAVQRLRAFLPELHRLSIGDRLNVYFSDGECQLDQESFFADTELTPEIEDETRGLVNDIIRACLKPMWDENDVQFGLYPLKALCLSNLKYIPLLSDALRSGVVDCQVYQPFLTETIFDIVAKYDWRSVIAELVFTGFLVRKDDSVIVEVRHLYKKGGLKQWLKNDENIALLKQILSEGEGLLSEEKKALANTLLTRNDN